ncbi:amino acid-polyamine-organocation family [Plasmopara halstedii]|uniref:Amino acid-polyamine-organocation family n=1 Tax=Plasmopara halstedii TaxID=4781 RepID=A0A0P1AWT4_PLAHL|nr:amino acid-polyamine-organocation family [Plasmopara halstedii]CEG46849.1 amino acid-polyamine-organocation family [Plasmopara halstedii]|eukprot:XP_024583218.1 amino acid-polyamine-organocation family [Plasmopara halstedii]
MHKADNRELRLSCPVTPSTADDVDTPDVMLLSAHQSEWVSAMTFVRAETPSQLRQRFIQIQVTDQRYKEPSWMHPNIGGEAQYVQGREQEIDIIREKLAVSETTNKLGEWTATSISGNAILSSVLFSAGQTVAKAGKLAPVAQLIVVIVVFCLRWVFEEVLSAVPLNGGFYTSMLNSAPKKVAAVFAVFSMLSYLSTAVVNAISAINYVNESLVNIPVMSCTVALLIVFALLCLLGIAESAFVALIFFAFHTFTLILLGVFSLVYAAQNTSIIVENMETSLPQVTLLNGAAEASNIVSALFLGYGTAMLGVTGFESSSQYVEEQARGVFPKTLRNMWILSSVFNVAYSLLALAVVPLDIIITNQSTLLAYMGRLSGGHWLEILVAVDALGVLAGAVLAAYVGINGLFQRLAIDRVLPSFLLKVNSLRGTYHYIILVFCIAASSLVFILDAEVRVLSGVFALAYLCVLLSFIIACLLLKVYREEIPRTRRSSWVNTCFCLGMIILGILANAISDVKALLYFFIYFAVFLVVIFLMLARVSLLRGLLYISRRFMFYRCNNEGNGAPLQQHFVGRHNFVGSIKIAKTIESIKNTPVVFFCKVANLPKINEAVRYVIENEDTYCLRLVHVCELDAPVPREFEDVVNLFDHIYPSMKIDFIAVTGAFDPAMVQWLSKSMEVPTNMMFMRQPANENIHRVSLLGVRVITD